jgi:hypothetical protein
MVPPDTAPKLVEVRRAKVPLVAGTSTLGAPSTMDLPMTDAPSASHNEKFVHSWLQDTVEAHRLLLGKIVCFTKLDFGGAHAAFRLIIMYAVRRYGFLLRTLPPNICRPYLPTANRAIRITVFRILGTSQDVQTLDYLNCAKRQLFLPSEFGGLNNAQSLELDAEPAQYASFTATLAHLITQCESESLGHMYGLIRQELPHVSTSTLPWAVQSRTLYDTIFTMGGFSESDLVVLTNPLNQDLSDYAGPDVL